MLSWEVLYGILLLPLVLMAANFLFGSCAVADALDQRVDGVAAGPMKHRRIGRTVLVCVMCCCVWQFVEVHYFLRVWEGRDVRECNIMHAAWATIDSCTGWLLGMHGDNSAGEVLPALVMCSTWDIAYLVVLSIQLGCMSHCIIATPQRPSKGQHTSFCRKCNCHVHRMDHHCYFLHNCIGSDNRHAFVGTLVACHTLAVLILCRCPVGFVMSSWHSMAGYGVTAVVAAGTLLLATFQFALLRKGSTTLGFLKHLKVKGWVKSIGELFA